MCCVPARVAGVGASPSPRRRAPTAASTRLVLAAAAIAGADEVYAIGGAQAIAALALGTETSSRWT